jgi:hypothetical protein
MTELDNYGEEKEDPTLSLPDISTPVDWRPDLSELGILEHDKGVCEDTYDNRGILRRANLQWDYVYDQTGRPTGLIAARSAEATRERRLISISEKRALLEDPTKNNSDFLTGLDLLIDEAACKITPPWVVGATRSYIKEQENGGPKSEKRSPASLPHRCRFVKSDGLRCLLWSSGRIKDDGLCRVHLRSIRSPGADIERARQKVVQAAPYAVDVLEELMENAVSEPARLKAATEILDRAGVRGGVELDIAVDTTKRSPADIVAERLQRLAQSAQASAALLPGVEVVDADVVVEDSDKVNGEELDQA